MQIQRAREIWKNTYQNEKKTKKIIAHYIWGCYLAKKNFFNQTAQKIGKILSSNDFITS